MKEISIQTAHRNEMIDITEKINSTLSVKNGMVFIYVPHTTAALTINEGADPDVRSDIINFLKKQIPVSEKFRHMEGNSDAHIKTSLLGSSEWLIVHNSRLVLGRWQSVYFCEFDGPRMRKVYINEMEK